MPTPVRTTNRRGPKVTKSNRTVRLTLDPPLSDILTNLTKAIAGYIDAQAAEQRSQTIQGQSRFQQSIRTTVCCSRCFDSLQVDSVVLFDQAGRLCDRCRAKKALRDRIFAQIAPKVRTVGGMAKLGTTYEYIERGDK